MHGSSAMSSHLVTSFLRKVFIYLVEESMALVGKIEGEKEVQASADKFFTFFKTQMNHLPDIHENVHSVELHKGEWHSQGAVKLWNYTIDGKSLSAKEQVEADDVNKTVSFNVVDGDPLKEFKKFKATVHVVAEDNGKSKVKWVVEFEKLHENISPPYGYLDTALALTSDTDAHLLNA